MMGEGERWEYLYGVDDRGRPTKVDEVVLIAGWLRRSWVSLPQDTHGSDSETSRSRSLFT